MTSSIKKVAKNPFGEYVAYVTRNVEKKEWVRHLCYITIDLAHEMYPDDREMFVSTLIEILEAISLEMVG